MPMAPARSRCLEASRASSLAAHSAASLAATAGLREASRLLRASEALARAATATLLSVAPPPRTRHGPGDQPDVANAPVCAAGASAATDGREVSAVKSKRNARRAERKKRRKGASAKQSVNMAIDPLQPAGEERGAHLAASLQPAVSEPLESARITVVPPGGAQEERAVRERSPRRAPRTPSSSLPSLWSPPSTVPSGFAVGQRVRLSGLVSRSDLNGKIGKVLSYDVTAKRYAVDVAGSSAPVRVLAKNLTPALFQSG